MEQWKPIRCPKDDGEMVPINGMSDAWKCIICGLEVWDGDVPTAEEYEELVNSRMVLQPASQKPFVSLSYVEGTVRGGSSKSGRSGWTRRKKKKVDLQNRYRIIMADKDRNS